MMIGLGSESTSPAIKLRRPLAEGSKCLGNRDRATISVLVSCPKPYKDRADSTTTAGLNCLNSDSLPPLFGQGAGVRYGGGVWKPHGGKLCASSSMNWSASPVHWRSQSVTVGKPCEISKALRQRSSAIRFLACQRSTDENNASR
jgi:hypothetical protein